MDVLCSFFFCKQKTAYEMRISDWSSDVCSSDLVGHAHPDAGLLEDARGILQSEADQLQGLLVRPRAAVALDERRLRRHPVRFGVDERAVHVPQEDRKSTRLNSSH